MWKSRQDVINTLRNSAILSVTEVKFNNEFSIPFNVGSTMFYLNVIVPDSFPSQPLKVTLSPPARHPLVNEKFEVVGSPAVNGATSMQCNLESIIADAIQDMKNPPPILIKKNDENDVRRTSEPFITNSSAIVSLYASNQTNHDLVNGYSNQIPIPSAPSLGYISPQSGGSADPDPISSSSIGSKQRWSPFTQWLPESIINKEESELKDILASEEEMLELQLKSPVTVHMNQQIESLVEETEAFAQGNLNMEGVWKERSTRLATCIDRLDTLASEVSSLQSKLAQAIDEQGPESQYYNLQVAVLQADEECENVSRRLFSSNDAVPITSMGNQTQLQTRVESFIEEYKEKRKLYHLRKAKQEQFARLLILQNNNASNATGAISNVNADEFSSRPRSFAFLNC